MSTGVRVLALVALGFICILNGWQLIDADFNHVGDDAGRVYAASPADYADETALTADDITPVEPDSPQGWVAECLVNIPAASQDNEPVVIAVLDTGIQADHEDLGGRVIGAVNFTDSPTVDDIYGHGTHVAGIIAATAANGIGIDGVAPQSFLLNVKVADDQGKCRMTALVAGIIWAVDNGAQVINISIQMHQPSPRLEEALAYAWENGVVVVAAAGNDGIDTPVFPACYADCIGVTAFDEDGELAPLANYGDWVDAAAPGCKIYSLQPGNTYGYKYGTSFATAYVSGLAARLLAVLEDASGDGLLTDEVHAAIDSLCGYDALLVAG